MGHVKSTDDTAVVLEAEFPLNPLFYLQISNEEGNYLFGQWWVNESKWSRSSQLCTMIPVDTQTIVKKLDGGNEFEVDAECQFLKDNAAKLVKIKIGTKEQKFVTKVVKATVTIPAASWKEWKEYRLKLWRYSKAWGGVDKGDDEDK